MELTGERGVCRSALEWVEGRRPSVYPQLHRHCHRRIRCFFSSRRRHTRYWRDWSSDVCSSDLCWLRCWAGKRKNRTEHPRLWRRVGWALSVSEVSPHDPPVHPEGMKMGSSDGPGPDRKSVV